MAEDGVMTTADYSAYEQDAADAGKADVSEHSLQEVGALAHRMRKLQEEVQQAEAYLKDKKAELRGVEFGELPNAMLALGLSALSLTGGGRIEVERGVEPSIRAADRERAYEWMRTHGHGSIVKNEITVRLGMKQDEAAEKAAAALIKLGLQPERKETVAPNTLKAWLREMVENGKPLPEEIGYYEYHRAKFKKT